MKKAFIYILLSVFPLYLGMTFYLYAGRADTALCRGIEVCVLDSAETPFISGREVKRIMERAGFRPVGKPLGSLNTENMERVLEKNQLIRRAECYKTPSGLLRIDIRQRVPILRVMGINGDFYIDNTGNDMPVSTNFTSYLPVATGYADREFARKELFPMARFLQKDPFWNAQIEQIHVLPDHTIELIPRIGDQVIYLGKSDHFERKLENLFLFYRKAMPKAGWDKYEKINLKFEDQVICTRRGD